MANDVNINIISKDKASAPIKRSTRAVRDLGNAAEKAGAGAKKNWSGVGDLFSGLLPRGLQSTVRGFKGAQRQIGRLSKSFKVLKGAIAATGLGLLVVALGEIVANWDSITAAITSSSQETQKQVELSREMVGYSKEQLDNISATENILKEQGKTEEDILMMRMQGTKQAIDSQKILVMNLKLQKEERVQATEEARKFTEGLVLMLSLPISMALSAFDQLTSALAYLGVIDEGTDALGGYTGAAADLLGFNVEEVEEKGDATIKAAEEQLTKLENQAAGFRLRVKNDDEQEQQKADAARDRATEKKLADEKFRADQLLKISRDLELRAIEDEEARLKRKREMAFKDAEQQLLDRGATLDELAILEEQYQLDLDEMTAKYEQQRKDKAEKDREGFLAAEEKYDAEQIQIARDTASAKQQVLDMQEETVMNSLSILSNLNDAFGKKQGKQSKKAFQNQKALSIAETLISTYFAAQKAFDSQIIPGVPDPSGPVRGTIAAAAAVAGGLARVASIKQQQFNGGSSSSGGAGGSGGPSRSGFSGPTGGQGIPMPQRLASPDQMRAFVVQSDLQASDLQAKNLESQTVL